MVTKKKCFKFLFKNGYSFFKNDQRNIRFQVQNLSRGEITRQTLAQL